MNDSIKRFVGRVAAVVSALSFAISSFAFPASAASNIRLSSASFASILGSTVQGYYLADDDTYKPITLNVSTSSYTINWNYNLGVSYASDLYTSPFIVATASIPSDLKLGSSSDLPLFQVDWNLHLSNVTYITTAAFNARNDGYYNASQFWSGSRSLFAQNNYWSVGATPDSVVPLAWRSNNTDMAGVMGIPTYTSVKYDCRLYHYDGDPIDVYFGTTYYGTVSYSSGGEVTFGLTCPYINDDYVVEGHEGFPSPPASIGSGTGTIGSEDSEGNRPFNFEVVVPDYSEQLDVIADPALTPEQSGALSGLDSVGEAVGEAVDDYDEVIDDIDSYEWEIDGDSFALDTIDGDLPDITPPSGVIDGVNDLWDLLELDRSAPIIIRYIPIFIIFAFGSYVIYGKWV